MLSRCRKIAAAICLCGWISGMMSGKAEAAVDYKESVSVETSSAYAVKIDAPNVPLHKKKTEQSEVVGVISGQRTCSVVSYEGGWAYIDTGEAAGYMKVSDYGTLVERTYETVDQEAELRNKVVGFALRFVGKPYVWGGTDPNKGADCSGFTSYVMKNAAGISLSHGSVAQEREGTKVDKPKPGDLIFYSSGGQINHVALYIGNGQIVHASTEKTGIKISSWNYRTPVSIVDVLS